MGDRLDLIGRALRGQRPAWAGAAGPGGAAEPAGTDDATAVDEVLARARYHGVVPLLDAELTAGHEDTSWPDALRHACRSDALALAMQELAHRAEVARVLNALARVDVPALLLKGTGLAYSLYPSPVLRPRADTDLLVPPERSARAAGVLRDLGYTRAVGPAGRFVGYQLGLRHTDARGASHCLDLHWRISNAQSFAWLFEFDELAAESSPVPALAPLAARLGNVHALVLALLHRAGSNVFQQPGLGDRLIWLYDMHLLVQAMTDDELDRFRSRVGAKRIAGIALEGLRCCAARFPSPRLADLTEALARGPEPESGAALLRARRLEREWIELRAIPAASVRVSYLASRLLPAAEYMREQFPERRGAPLVSLHLRRALSALRRRATTASPDG